MWRPLASELQEDIDLFSSTLIPGDPDYLPTLAGYFPSAGYEAVIVSFGSHVTNKVSAISVDDFRKNYMAFVSQLSKRCRFLILATSTSIMDGPDGTLNEEVNYLHRPEDMHLLAGVPEALRRLKEAGFKLVVVTNQAGVARGYYTEEDVKVLHRYMNELLAAEGAEIDGFYYCPHHPVHGIGSYKKECSCRKPGIGMFLQAEEQFTADKSHSYMIGDKLLDTQAGKNYGVTSILVGTGYGKELYEASQAKKDEAPSYDYYAENLPQAADWILRRK